MQLRTERLKAADSFLAQLELPYQGIFSLPSSATTADLEQQQVTRMELAFDAKRELESESRKRRRLRFKQPLHSVTYYVPDSQEEMRDTLLMKELSSVLLSPDATPLGQPDDWGDADERMLQELQAALEAFD
jgi:hypothetical protein